MSAPRRRGPHLPPRLLALVLTLAAGVGALPLRADIQSPPGRDRRGLPGRGVGRNEPTATAATRPASAGGIVNVEVPLGGAVDIPLHASGQLGKRIDFLLREPPAHGTLGEVRSTGRDSAVVTYTHRAGDGPTTDSFVYAVQAPGTAVSAPATVEVRVLDDPPHPVLVPAGGDGGDGGVAPDLDFGDVPAGNGTARRELWLENRGGGVAVGTLVPPAPWVVDGVAAYRLAREERQGFTLVFKPELARGYAGRIVIGRGPGASAQLSGVGLRPDGTRPPPAGTAEESVTPAVAMLIPAAGRDAPVGAGPDRARTGGSTGVSPGGAPPSGLPPVPDPGSPAVEVPLNLTTGGPAYGPLATTTRPNQEATVKHLAVQDRGKHTLTITWPAPKPAPVSYRVERRRLWMENDQLQAEWDPYDNVAVTAEPDGTIHALLRGLEANEPQTVRVMAVDGRGMLSAPSAQVISATLPDPHWWERVTALEMLFAGLAVCLLLLWRRRHVYGG